MPAKPETPVTPIPASPPATPKLPPVPTGSKDTAIYAISALAGKQYRMRQIKDGRLVPRDPNYPLTSAGVHTALEAVKK